VFKPFSRYVGDARTVDGDLVLSPGDDPHRRRDTWRTTVRDSR